MGSDLLGPLVRGVQRMPPAHGVVVVGIRSAQLVQVRHEKLRCLEGSKTIEVRHFVVRPIQCALGRGSVVADDVVDERIIEKVQLFQEAHDTSDMVVRVLHVTRV